MTLVFKYIFRRLLFATILLTCVLVIALWLTQSLRFLDMIVNRNVSLQGYFYLVGFLIPDLLVVILPICLFVSVIFFYNKFQADHELAVWRSAGLSNICIAKPAIILTIFIAAFTFIINVYIIPPSFKHFKDMEHNLRQQFSSAMLHEGRFNSVNGATIYIKQRYRSGRMEGVFLYNHDAKLPYTLFAREGKINLADGGERYHLVLKNGFRQEKDLKTGQLKVLQFEALNYDLSNLTKAQNVRTVRPYEKSITELLEVDDRLDKDTQTRYRSAAHQRILQPFFGFIYVLLALNFMLKPHYNRRGRQWAIFWAFSIGFLFHIMITTCINFNCKFSGSIYLAYFIFISWFIYLVFNLFEYRSLPATRTIP